MDILKNTKLNNTVKIITVAFAVAMFLFGIIYYHADFAQLSLLFVFAVFYVQLPGLLILDFLKIDLRHISSTLIVGFFTGWAFVTAEYFLGELIHTDIITYVLGPVFSVIYIINIVRKKTSLGQNFRFSFSRLSTAACIFFVLLLLYALLETQYVYLNPAVGNNTAVNADVGYHLGIINSLSHGYPVESPWIHGRTINYHIFTELLLSVPVRLFGIASDVALLSFGPYLTAYTFGFSLYAMFKELLTRESRTGIYSLCTLLANLYITRRLSTSIAFLFAFKNENAAGYGICGIFILLIVLKYWYDSYCKGSRHWPLLILLVAFTMLETGIKGPMAIVFVAGLWGTYILGIILRKVSFKAILPLLLISLGFIIVYVTVLGSKGSTNGGGDSIIAFFTITDIAFYKAPLIAFLTAVGIPKIIRYGILFGVFIVFMFTAFTMPCCVGFFRELYLVLRGRKEYSLPYVTVYAAFTVGLIAICVLNYSGHSQIYFGLVSVFLCPLISFRLFEDLEESYRLKLNRGKLLKTTAVVFFIMLLVTTLTFASFICRHIEESLNYKNNSVEYVDYLNISRDEYNAMIWLKENTPKDSLIATDRYYSVPLEDYSYEDRWANRFFLYAAYSNRFCYIAGSGYNLPAAEWRVRKEMIETNELLYQADNENRGDLARELGISYVVVSKRFTNIPSLENEDYKLVYSNKDIDIYEIQ